LPLFAAFDLLKSEAGRATLQKYFSTYAKIARENHVGMILETVTWRASKDWGKQLGYTPAEIKQINLQSVASLQAIRDEFETEKAKIVISGCIGPRGDGYITGEMMTADEAEQYHAEQIKHFMSPMRIWSRYLP